jgi:hypothetical protein
VDGIGVVQKFEPIGESHELVIRAPAALAGYIAKRARSPSTASASPSTGSTAATSRST